jgi:predicted nucleotidyltransferase
MRARNVSNINTLTYQETKALEELISKVNAAFEVKNIILFGSKARGDSNESSDVDIMVIIEEEEMKEKRNKLSEISFEVNYKYDTNIYAGLGYSSKWENKEYLSLPLPSNITKEGVELLV